MSGPGSTNCLHLCSPADQKGGGAENGATHGSYKSQAGNRECLLDLGCFMGMCCIVREPLESWVNLALLS